MVGAGPVGLVSALLLAAEGFEVLLLERSTEPSTQPRAVHLDDEALRVLQGLGLDAAVRSHANPSAGYELRSADGRLLHSFPRLGQPLGHPRSVLIHQPYLEAVLRQAVAAQPLIDLRAGAEVVEVRARPAAVTVRDAAGERVVAASFVLGCDGAASTVRRSLGIGWRDLGFEQTWLVVDLLVDEVPTDLALPQQRCGGRRPATSVPVGRGRHRFEFMALPGEDPSALDASDLVRGWGVQATAIERAAVYTFHALVAQRWRVGPVFLLGDAAHLMPPFLGQGLCSGFRDAANLAWKLALAARAGGAEALLDTYEAERRPHATAVTRRTATLGRLLTGRGAGWDRARAGAAGALDVVGPLRRALEGLEPPPLPRGPLVARRTWRGAPGRPFPQPVLADSQAGGDAVLGPGFAHVGVGIDPRTLATPAVRRLWEGLGARPVRVPAVEHGGPRGARPRVAVVRPDRAVLGTAGGPEELTALTARVARLLG